MKTFFAVLIMSVAILAVKLDTITTETCDTIMIVECKTVKVVSSIDSVVSVKIDTLGVKEPLNKPKKVEKKKVEKK